MISTAAFNTNAEVSASNAQAETGALENSYATAPMAAVLPAYQPLSDEELHSSFEEAISSRLSAVHSRLARLDHSSPLPAYRATETLPPSFYDIDINNTMPTAASVVAPLTASLANWHRRINQLALSLILLSGGFDLMGLLVLHMR